MADFSHLVKHLGEALRRHGRPRCAHQRCKRRHRPGQQVRVVPVFSAHDSRNWGNVTAEPTRVDLYCPPCADELGLIFDPGGGVVYLPAEGGA